MVIDGGVVITRCRAVLTRSLSSHVSAWHFKATIEPNIRGIAGEYAMQINALGVHVLLINTVKRVWTVWSLSAACVGVRSLYVPGDIKVLQFSWFFSCFFLLLFLLTIKCCYCCSYCYSHYFLLVFPTWLSHTDFCNAQWPFGICGLKHKVYMLLSLRPQKGGSVWKRLVMFG